MAATSNIVGMIVIVAIILATWGFIQFNEFNQAIYLYEANQTLFEQERMSSDLSNIMQVTEPNTKIPIYDILGGMAYSRKEYTIIGDENINQQEALETYFDELYGKENYYLKIESPPAHIRLFFVVDGSESMQDDLGKIDELLPELGEAFRGLDVNYTIESKVFIIKANDTVSCSKLTNDIDCEDITGDYSFPITGGKGSIGCPKEGVGIYNKYFADTLKNAGSEFFMGYDEALYLCNSASRKANSPEENAIRGQYYEDWASGTAYVAKDVPLETKTTGKQTVTFIFPISDELNTGSESDSTYDARANTDLNIKRRAYEAICKGGDARLERGQKSINHANEVLSEYPYLVFPIAVKPGGIVPGIPVCNAQGGRCLTGNCIPCCVSPSLQFCSTCTSEGPHVDEQVREKILEQMNDLASANGGSAFDLSGDDYDTTALKELLVDLILEKTYKTFEFGTKKQEERYAVTRYVPLKDNSTAEINFWKYKKISN